MRRTMCYGLVALLLLAACGGGDDDVTDGPHETAVAVDAVADLVLEALAAVEPTDFGVKTEKCPRPQGVFKTTFLSERLLEVEDVDISIFDRVIDAVPGGRVLEDSEERNPLGSDTPERSIYIAVEHEGVKLRVSGVVRDRVLSVTVESDCR